MSEYAPIYNNDDRRLYSPQFTKTNVMRKRREWLDNELKENGKCDKCGRDYNLTIDHIVPMFFLKDAGFDFEQFYDEENLRLLCKPCNALKNNHLDFSTPKTKQIIRKYLEKI